MNLPNNLNMPSMVDGNYIHTFSGKRVYLPNTDPKSIVIEDIAHALSIAPRFAGHLDTFLSVAEHSVNVADIVSMLGGTLENKRQALLHDATEAYLCDIPTPYKVLIPGYKDLEDALWSVIAQKFGVPVEMDPIVKAADRMALMSERDAYKSVIEDWGFLEETTRVNLRNVTLTQSQAKGVFTDRFKVLFPEFR